MRCTGKVTWRRAAAAGAAAAGLVLGTVGTAQGSAADAQGTSYESRHCPSSGQCLYLFQGSSGSGMPVTACFAGGRKTPDHWGRVENGGTRPVRYVFRKYEGPNCWSNYDGQPLERNVASTINETRANQRLYTGYSYTGTSQRIKPDSGWLSGPKNVNRHMKNKNHSSRKAN